jgi:hypothetical protein
MQYEVVQKIINAISCIFSVSFYNIISDLSAYLMEIRNTIEWKLSLQHTNQELSNKPYLYTWKGSEMSKRSFK